MTGAASLGPLVRLAHYSLELGDPGTINLKILDAGVKDIATGPPYGCGVADAGTSSLLTDIIRAQFIESTDADDPDGNYLRDLSFSWFEGKTSITGVTSGVTCTLSPWYYQCTDTVYAPIVPFERIYKPGGAGGMSWTSVKQTAWGYIGAGLRAWWIDLYWRNNIAGDQTGGFVSGEACTIQ